MFHFRILDQNNIVIIKTKVVVQTQEKYSTITPLMRKLQ
jgi:hypothetical protein